MNIKNLKNNIKLNSRICDERFKIGIIGTGKMAEAIISGILQKNKLKSTDICAYEKDLNREKYIAEKYKIYFFKSLKGLISNSIYILVAVKPQNLNEVLNKSKGYLDKNENIVISIVAGIPTNFFEKKLNLEIPVIRVMPNAPALLGNGMAVLSKGKFAKDIHIKFTLNLMKSIGSCIILEESLQNAVTAVSGSGPAYFFLFFQEFVNSSIRIGIPEKVANCLVFKTMQGSIKMLKKFDFNTVKLIEMVASPGGTTEAALNKFREKEFAKVLQSAISAAKNRAYELQNLIETEV